MKRKSILFGLILMAISMTAAAADFGAHIGYYDNDVKKAYIGADVSFVLGPVALMPNVDYWKEHGAGYWLGGGDVVLRGGSTGMAWWVGAGPTYGYITGDDNNATATSRAGIYQHNGPTNPGSPTNPGNNNPSYAAGIGGPF